MQLASARLETANHTYPISEGEILSAHVEQRKQTNKIFLNERRRFASTTLPDGLVLRGFFRLYSPQTPETILKTKTNKPAMQNQFSAGQITPTFLVAHGLRFQIVRLSQGSNTKIGPAFEPGFGRTESRSPKSNFPKNNGATQFDFVALSNKSENGFAEKELRQLIVENNFSPINTGVWLNPDDLQKEFTLASIVDYLQGLVLRDSTKSFSLTEIKN